MSHQSTFAEQHHVALISLFDKLLEERKEYLVTHTRCEWAEHSRQPMIDHLQSTLPIIATLEGLHSVAFMTKCCVVKTNLCGEPELDGQATWLRWCVKNQDNPLAPRISLLVFDKASDRYLVVMERLEEHTGFGNIDAEVRYQIDTGGLGKLFSPGVNVRRVKSELVALVDQSLHAIQELEVDINNLTPEDDELKEMFIRGIEEHRLSIVYIHDVLQMCRITSRLTRHFKRVVNKLHSEIKKGQYLLDVHSLNWMKRKDGQYVLLDPLN